MIKDELKKEAEEYAEGMAKYYASTHEDYIPSQFEKYLRNAYISSAEPREKRITELEKENARLATNEKSLLAERKIIVKENTELKLKLEALEGQTPWKDIKDKSELIKENAELKERADKADLDSVLFFNQLCKAKEILKAVVDFYPTTTATILCEAEKFISEVEK